MKLLDQKKITNSELNEIECLKITNKRFIELDKKHSGFILGLNFLIVIIHLEEIKNINNINSSDKSTTMLIDEFIHEINDLATKAISKKDGGSLSDNIELYLSDNIFI